MELPDAFRGRVSIVLAGNELNADDRLGLELYERLSTLSDPDLQILFTSTAPENFLGEIIDFKPERAVVVDAGDFGGEPGETRVLDLTDLESTSVSTHRMPLKVFAGRLGGEGIETAFVAVQAKDFTTGAQMSGEVEAAVVGLFELIRDARTRSYGSLEHYLR